MTADRGEAIALFRFGLIAEAASPRLSQAQRGGIVRAVAARTHIHPDGSTLAVSRNTLDRWVRAYRERGLEGLRPTVRSDVGAVRRHPELFTEAAMLRREKPERGAGQIADILRLRHGIRVSERNIGEQLRRRGLHRAALAPVAQAFGCYQASRPSERWIGDVLTGGYVPTPSTERSRRVKLFLLVDDHSRLLVHGRWVTEENTPAGQDVLRAAIARRAVPASSASSAGGATGSGPCSAERRSISPGSPISITKQPWEPPECPATAGEGSVGRSGPP